MWDLQSFSYVYFLMSKSNHGCHVEFEMSCSLSGRCTLFHHLRPKPVRSLAEDKQMQASLALVLTVLAPTKGLMLENFLGTVHPTNHQVISPLHPSYVSQCCFVFYAQALEMPEFSGNHGGAKLNVAELC